MASLPLKVLFSACCQTRIFTQSCRRASRPFHNIIVSIRTVHTHKQRIGLLDSSSRNARSGASFHVCKKRHYNIFFVLRYERWCVYDDASGGFIRTAIGRWWVVYDRYHHFLV